MPQLTEAPSFSTSDPDKPRVMNGAEIATRSLHQLYAGLSPARQKAAWDLVDWLLLRPRTIFNTEEVVAELCRRMIASGLPLDRYGSSTTVLNAEHDAIGRIWTHEAGTQETVYARPIGEDGIYMRSPLHEASTTHRWVELWLPTTPDSRFDIVRELKDGGYVHYLCIPLTLSRASEGWVTMATRSPTGFSDEDLMLIAFLIPPLTTVIDVRTTWVMLDRLLRTYVGEEPHRAILEGNVKRGQVSTIRSAILFADMRDSTGQTAELSAVGAVNLFNDFFDALVPPIEQRGGEVLKYIGDGLLAIYRETAPKGRDAADRALASAEEIFARVDTYNLSRPEARPIELGIALHYGEAAYGNVGSGSRLDFTVIGRDVGLASRIGGMNARLGEPLLMSESFAKRLRRRAVPLGSYPARGFTRPVAVFRPEKTDPQPA